MSELKAGNILVVDDEPNAVRVLSAILTGAGFSVASAFSVPEARQKIGVADLDALITDMKMPEEGGIALFEHVSTHHPDLPVIFLTAYGSVESAVATMGQGAYHYFIKPPDYESLKIIVARAVEQRRLKREVAKLRLQISGDRKIVGRNAQIQRLLETVRAVKDSDSSILVSGETGTGKELVARALHYDSYRYERPFVAVNCAAIPRELLEAELFGYEKGAFTGATSRRLGRIEQVAGGTLFLDEIGDLDLSLQAKLLRVLQERSIERLGSSRTIPVQFRLVCATNRHLEQAVAAGMFRPDLFYRLNVVQLTIPPLRERVEDLPFLIAEFLGQFNAREGKAVTLSPAVMRILTHYSWPGNVRQLANILERAVVLTQGRQISPRELPAELFLQPAPTAPTSAPNGHGGSLKEMETLAIKAALDRFQGNKSQAARHLGLSRKAFYKRLKDFS
ncbi:MAG: sigma-54-dependent Fis family transcriptional regulator [Desulfuromonadales bacterium]|nr:sigma-54-dependent Fis family transcriptional regulator [Desulfuromonadales bacterium]